MQTEHIGEAHFKLVEINKQGCTSECYFLHFRTSTAY
jgi:hypothetical protein